MESEISALGVGECGLNIETLQALLNTKKLFCVSFFLCSFRTCSKMTFLQLSLKGPLSRKTFSLIIFPHFFRKYEYVNIVKVSKRVTL